MLDTIAREWLSLIEEKKQEVVTISEQLTDELKRYGRLKSQKMLISSKATIDTLESQKTQACRFIHDETLNFFRSVFKVELYQPIVVRSPNGSFSKAIYASQFIARMLSNGAGVFTVTGDSVSVNLHEGVPACEMLMAAESKGEWLLAIA